MEPIDDVLELAEVTQIYEEFLKDNEVSTQGGNTSGSEVVVFQDQPEAAKDSEELEEATMEEVVFRGLAFVIIDENEYFFLVDIQSMTGYCEDEPLSTLYNQEHNIDFDYPKEGHPRCTDLASAVESSEVPIAATIQEML